MNWSELKEHMYQAVLVTPATPGPNVLGLLTGRKYNRNGWYNGRDGSADLAVVFMPHGKFWDVTIDRVELYLTSDREDEKSDLLIAYLAAGSPRRT